MGNKPSSSRDQNPPPSEILEFHPIKQNESGMQNEKSTKKAFLKLRSWCSRIRDVVQADNIQSRNDRRRIVQNLVGELQGLQEEIKEEEVKKEEEKKQFKTESATTNTRTAEEVLWNRNFVPPRLHPLETSEVRIEIENIERPDAVRPKNKTSYLLGKEAPKPQIPNLKPKTDAFDLLKTSTILSLAREENIKRDELERLVDARLRDTCKKAHHSDITWIERNKLGCHVDPQLKDIKEYQSRAHAPVAQVLNVKPTADASDKQKTWTIPSKARRDTISWLGRDEFESRADSHLRDIKEYQSGARAPVAQVLNVKPTAEASDTLKTWTIPSLARRDPWNRTQITQPTPEAPASISYAKVTSSTKISESNTAKVLLQDPQKPETKTVHAHAQKAAVQHERPATQVKSTSSKKKQRTGSWYENSKPVQRIFTKLKYVNQDSSSRKERVDRFLAETKKALERMNCDIMKNCTFYPAGSSFEGTAINRSADFDMLLILPEPYRGDNFQALESRYPGYYKLKWKEAFDYGHDDDDYYYDEDDYDEDEYDDYYDEDEYDDYYDEDEYDDYYDENEEYDGYYDENEEYDGNDEYNNNQEYDEYYDEDDEYDVHVEQRHRDSQEGDSQEDYDDEYDEYDEYEDDEDYWDENANVDFADTDWPKYVRNDGILNAFKLLQYIFKKLEVAMNEINSMNHEWKLTYRPQFTSFIVFLNDSDGNSLKVDIVPQIGKCDWKGLPGLRQPNELARPFHECLSDGSIQFPIFFSLVPAPYMLKQQDGKCLVTTAFSMMERHCLQASDVVRNAVIFAKILSKNHGWKKKFGLRPFHMKRVAAKHLDEVNDLPLWDAFLKLLEYLSTELRNGGIDGYFIKKQKVFSKGERIEFAEAIEMAKNSVTPKDLSRKQNNKV